MKKTTRKYIKEILRTKFDELDTESLSYAKNVEDILNVLLDLKMFVEAIGFANDFEYSNKMLFAKIELLEAVSKSKNDTIDR